MDKDIEETDLAVGAVGSEGERSSSTLSMARDERPAAPLAPGQRWSLARKRDVVLRLMQGEPVEACPAGSRCRCGSRRSGGGTGSPGSTPGCASVTTIRRTANAARRIAASAS